MEVEGSVVEFQLQSVYRIACENLLDYGERLAADLLVLEVETSIARPGRVEATARPDLKGLDGLPPVIFFKAFSFLAL